MARGKAHSEEVKAQVMSALLSGQGVPEVAKQYSLPERTIRLWREANFAEVCREKKERIGEKLLDYLSDSITALRVQLRTFSDTDYLRKQSAAEAATLHGVLADKAFRILDALARIEAEGGDGGDSDRHG